MKDEELVEALRRTIDDRRITRGERKALRALVEDAELDDRRRTLLRAKAFGIARDVLESPRGGEVMAWLEDVIGLMSPKPAPTVGARAPRAPAEAWFSPGEAPLACIVGALRSVKARADICVFTITDNRISDGILSAARRGVQVRMITDADKSEDKGSDVERFIKSGVPVALDRPSAHMHHKFALFDRVRLMTGSFNWTRSASGVNRENLLVTGDAGLIEAYEEEFERLWRRYAER